jgi:transcription termination/antitermination protein NusG
LYFVEFGFARNEAETKGGEALAQAGAQWFVLWTHSNFERRVDEQLRGKGFETFLPMVKSWSRRRGIQSSIAAPMFPGYVFVHHAIDKRSHVEMLKAHGVVRILGERWDRPASVADDAIEAIRRMAAAEVPVFPYPYLTEGQEVRITGGPLAGVEGILIATKPHKGLLVVSIELLQRSVAVEVESTQVQPVSRVPAASRWHRHVAAAPLPGSA